MLGANEKIFLEENKAHIWFKTETKVDDVR